MNSQRAYIPRRGLLVLLVFNDLRTRAAGLVQPSAGYCLLAS